MISFIKSKKSRAFAYLALNAKNLGSDQLMTPTELNKELAKVMRDGDNDKQTHNGISISLEKDSTESYLYGCDMTAVLKILGLAKTYQNIKGKKEIRKGKRGRPKNSDMTHDNSGGRPSAYTTTEMVKKLQKVMSKPEACDRLRETLINSNLVFNYEKLILKALYYAAKKDKTVVKELFRMIMPNEFIKSSEFRTFLEKFLSTEESQLDTMASEGARISIENKRFDGHLFVGALLPL